MNYNLPIGIEDYAVAQNYYYVDKTDLIKEIIDTYIGKSVLVTRPRRFGKSLNLSMLEQFFSNKYSSLNNFKNRNIYTRKDICDEYLNSYPVIRINFKNIIATNYNALCNQIIDAISNLYRKFPEVLNSTSLFDIERKDFLNVIEKKYKEPFEYVNSILNLSSYLNRIYNKKIIILIDEYDTPIQASYDNKFYDEAISFFKSFYSATLKGNEFMLFSFVTGVLEIGKESLFSGLNNLSVSTVIDNKLTNYFGFTDQEIDGIVKYFNLEQSKNDLKNWYGGYGTESTNIYNPWSILNYLENKELSYYWINTSTNSLINTLIDSNNDDYIKNKEIFAEFLNNEKLLINFNPRISYRDINNNTDSLFSFLIQTGYLTARKNNNGYALYIPNFEVKYVFQNEVIGANTPKESLNIASSLKNAFINSSSSEIKEILEKYIITSFSYFDLKDEKCYQIMITGILATLFDEYVVKSEVNNQKGRCDIMISPKSNDNLGIIIELKKYKSKTSQKRLLEYAELAISQIKEKEYYQELKEKNIKKIILYGFAIDSYNIEISYQEL